MTVKIVTDSVSLISPVIGTHTGPSAVSVSLITK